ncbi:hypothetical protein KIPB_006868 [Kipferlia bialata]|uniref:Uncharacterized protein n=1 Tax=Kipferlia bialata TaxID=797122 RepID=A0A9K3CYE4_9EUKA|nr:hypothetical protein KIPB_006868 [Kipferlia bialata]|eukprot:g6868.t1
MPEPGKENWLEYAMSVNKFPRKTIGFGKYDKRERCHQDEIHIRELTVIDGGIGCGVWDGSIYLARWIRQSAQTHMQGRRCIEEVHRGTLMRHSLSIPLP